MFKLDLEKAEEQRSHCQHPMDHGKSKRFPEKHLLLLHGLRQSLWLYGSQQTVGNSSRDGNTRPSDLPAKKSVCRSRRNRTRHATIDWFWTWKWVCQGCILSPCLLNLCAEYIMRNAGLDEAQAGIKIVRRNISNLRYADDTTLMAESEEELKPLDEGKREEWKSWLKTQHSKN